MPLGVKIAASGWSVYSVNGTAVRNAHDPEFSGFAVGGIDPYVPKQEVWIENTRPFEDMLHDVTAAEKHALEQAPPPEPEMPKQAEVEPPFDLVASLRKVSNQRFWKGVRYITKTADWPDQHQEELARGVSAYAKSVMGDRAAEQPNIDPKDMLSWLFQSKEPTLMDELRNLFKGLGKVPKPGPRGSETPNRIPTGEHWGKADQAGQGMGASGMPTAQSGPDSQLGNPSGWAR